MKTAARDAMILLLALPAAAAAQQSIPGRLSLGDALRLAIERSPVLKLAANAVDLAEADRLDASRRPNPVFAAGSEEYPLFGSNHGPFFKSQDLSARIEQELETAGKRRLRTRAADLAVEVQQAEYGNVLRLLKAEVRTAYFLGVLAQAELELAETILAEIDRVIELNRVRLEAGEISGIDLKRVEVERLRFLDDVYTARLGLANARATLLSLMGVAEEAVPFAFAEPLDPRDPAVAGDPGMPPPVPLSELERLALAVRPDLAAAGLEQERAGAEVLVQKAGAVPNLTVGAGYQRSHDHNAIILELSLPIRLFHRNEGGIARALAEKNRAENLAALARLQALLEVRKARNAVEINRQRVEYMQKEAVRKAEEAREIAGAAYRLGGTDLIDLLDTERAWRETSRLFYRALYDYRISLYELGSAVGVEEQRK